MPIFDSPLYEGAKGAVHLCYVKQQFIVEGKAFRFPYAKKDTHRKVCVFFGDPYGNRTHVTAVKGRCLNRLTNGPGSGDLT